MMSYKAFGVSSSHEVRWDNSSGHTPHVTFRAADQLFECTRSFVDHVGCSRSNVLRDIPSDRTDMIGPVSHSISHGERYLLLLRSSSISTASDLSPGNEIDSHIVGAVLRVENTIGGFEIFCHHFPLRDKYILALYGRDSNKTITRFRHPPAN